MTGIGARAGLGLPQRMQVRLASLRSRPGAILSQPDPPVIGDPAQARRLAAGVLLFEGSLVETEAPTPWEVTAPDPAWSEALHGHDWLDHAAVSEEREVVRHLVGWVWAWIDAHGDGSGPGWSPELVARRLIRWIAHSAILLRGQPADRSAVFFQMLGTQARLLAWTWSRTRRDVDRIEALTGLVYANLSLEGSARAAQSAIARLGRECTRITGEDGTIPSRNPEELARIAALLIWSAQTIEDAGHKTAAGHRRSLQAVLPNVRALMHVSGAMARFHGGRSGEALALTEIETHGGASRTPPGLSVMDYCRLHRGRSVLIADGGPPPGKGHVTTRHASALAFEFSHDGLDLIVNSGSGKGFGADATRASRRLPAHSAVELGERCPGRLRPGASNTTGDVMHLNGKVASQVELTEAGAWFLGETTLYESITGLKIERRLHLSHDGTKLSGEDTTLATRAETRARALAAFPDPDAPCLMRTRFHLHPDVTAVPALNGQAVALKTPDGQRWLITAEADRLELRPALYFDETRPKPRATLQIVAETEVLEYWGRITWSLEKLPEGASPLRAQARRL